MIWKEHSYNLVYDNQISLPMKIKKKNYTQNIREEKMQLVN